MQRPGEHMTPAARRIARLVSCSVADAERLLQPPAVAAMMYLATHPDAHTRQAAIALGRYVARLEGAELALRTLELVAHDPAAMEAYLGILDTSLELASLDPLWSEPAAAAGVEPEPPE